MPAQFDVGGEDVQEALVVGPEVERLMPPVFGLWIVERLDRDDRSHQRGIALENDVAERVLDPRERIPGRRMEAGGGRQGGLRREKTAGRVIVLFVGEMAGDPSQYRVWRDRLHREIEPAHRERDRRKEKIHRECLLSCNRSRGALERSAWESETGSRPPW